MVEEPDFTNMHPLVELLYTRMQTAPEEFEGEYGRWHPALEAVRVHASEPSVALIFTRYNAIQLDKAHREMMEELLYPAEQRKKDEHAKEMELAKQRAQRHLRQAGQQLSGQAVSALNQLQGAQNLYSQANVPYDQYALSQLQSGDRSVPLGEILRDALQSQTDAQTDKHLEDMGILRRLMNKASK